MLLARPEPSDRARAVRNSISLARSVVYSRSRPFPAVGWLEVVASAVVGAGMFPRYILITENMIDFFNHMGCHWFQTSINPCTPLGQEQGASNVTGRKSRHRHRKRPRPRPRLRPGARPPGRRRRRQRRRRRRRPSEAVDAITAAGGTAVAVVAPVGTTEAAKQLVRTRRRGRSAGSTSWSPTPASCATRSLLEDDRRGLRRRHQRPPARHLHLRPRGRRLLREQGDRRPHHHHRLARPASAATSARPTTPPPRPASSAWSAPGRWS